MLARDAQLQSTVPVNPGQLKDEVLREGQRFSQSRLSRFLPTSFALSCVCVCVCVLGGG